MTKTRPSYRTVELSSCTTIVKLGRLRMGFGRLGEAEVEVDEVVG